MSGPESVAAVVVTYNRADLLTGLLAGLASLGRPLDRVYVVDNASVDETPQVLARNEHGLPLRVIRSEQNLGGAGGFHAGLAQAYADGHDRFWLLDDDVVPRPDCLEVLLARGTECLMAVREDTSGRLAEYAALRFDLSRPWVISPKTASVMGAYPHRAAMPEAVTLENVAFEGFLLHRRVVERVGLPDERFFVFYDDCDYAIRARRAGFRIEGVRDAVLVRQLDFDQQHDLAGWKGFYMYRNLFAVHFRYGTNPAVRAKPYAIALAVTVLGPVRGGRAEVGNVWRALRAARALRRPPDPWVHAG